MKNKKLVDPRDPDRDESVLGAHVELNGERAAERIIVASETENRGELHLSYHNEYSVGN